MPQSTWISFDLDETLADQPFVRMVLQRKRALFKHPDALNALREEHRHRLHSGQPVLAYDWDDLYETVRIKLGLPQPLPSLLELAEGVDFPAHLVYPDVPAALETLRSWGHRLAVATNGFLVWQSLALHHLGLGFDAVLTPDQAGFVKPQAGYFAALPRISQDAGALEALVHVGDLLSQDVLGAQRAGARAVWIWRTMPDALRACAVLERKHAANIGVWLRNAFEAELEQYPAFDQAVLERTPQPDALICEMGELLEVIDNWRHNPPGCGPDQIQALS